MDLKQNKVQKSNLTLEARHSKSIEASNKIRASLTPRIFIPRVLRRKLLTKDDDKNGINSERNKNLLNNHGLKGKDQNKIGATTLLRIVKGKYAKKLNYKSVLNEISSTEGCHLKAAKKTTETKKCKEIADEVEMNRTVEENQNCLDYDDMILQYVGLTRRRKTPTLTPNSAKSMQAVEKPIAKSKNLKRRNLRKRRHNPKTTTSKRSKSENFAGTTINNQQKSPHIKKSKTDKPISTVSTYRLYKTARQNYKIKKSSSPQFDNTTFAQQKDIKSLKNNKANVKNLEQIPINSRNIDNNSKSNTKVKDLKTIILSETFKKSAKTKPSYSPHEIANINYTNINLSSATNLPQPEKCTNIAGSNNQKDIETELIRRGRALSKIPKASRSNVKDSEIISSKHTKGFLNSSRLEIPPTNVTNYDKFLKPLVPVLSKSHRESQNLPQFSIQHMEEPKIPYKQSKSLPKSRFNNLQNDITKNRKRYLKDGDIIHLDDESDTINLSSSHESSKTFKQSADTYRSSYGVALEIHENSSITQQLSPINHSQQSCTSNHEHRFIFKDTPLHLASDSNHCDLISFHKNSTLVPEFQNIVRDTMSHLHTTSTQDLEIILDLMNIENSINEFSTYLLKTFEDIKEMENQTKQDMVYINSGEYNKLLSNKKRSQKTETIATPKPSTIVCDSEAEIRSSIDNNKEEDTITILIEADQMPTQTITFKKSEIIIPTTCTKALIESEINLPTPPPEEISYETPQSIKVTSKPKHRNSDVTIISNIELPNLDLRNSLKPTTIFNESLQSQSNQDEPPPPFISYLERPTSDLQNRIQKEIRQCHGLSENHINSKSTENIQGTQINLSTQDSGYSYDTSNFPTSSEISQNIWNSIHTAVPGQENPYIMENFTENQISIQNLTIPPSNRIQDLIKFRRMPKYYDADASSFQQHFNNATEYHTSFLSSNHFPYHTSSHAKKDLSYMKKHKSRSKPNKNPARKLDKTYNVLPNHGSQPITPSKCSVSVTNSSPIYTRAPLLNSSYWLQNSVNSVVGNNFKSRNPYQNIYQQNLRQSQESHQEFSSYYTQPSVTNIYNEHGTSYHCNSYFNNPIIFNNRPPFSNAPLNLDYNSKLIARNNNNFQFHTNSLNSHASLPSRSYQNSIPPPINNQDTGYNYNAYTFPLGPSEDGRMRSNT